MREARTAIKSLLHRILPKQNEYTDLRVLTGPAAGSYLRLDVRREGQYWLGNYDRWVFRSFRLTDYLQPGMIAWDCGSYVGFYAAAFRRVVGATGTVHAFEASRPNYERLAHLPVTNGWSNVHVHHLAIGPDHTTVQMTHAYGQSGPLGMSRRSEDDHGVVYPVQSSGVDELVYERGIPAPNFIKFDLEDAEEFALHNGERVFTEHRPALQLEVHRNEAKLAACRFLERYRYRAQLIPTGTALDADSLARMPETWLMLLCTPLP